MPTVTFQLISRSIWRNDYLLGSSTHAWKRILNKHKDTFTFGVPISYSKVQREIKQILNKIDKTEDEREIGFSNEKQK